MTMSTQTHGQFNALLDLSILEIHSIIHFSIHFIYYDFQQFFKKIIKDEIYMKKCVEFPNHLPGT